MGAGVTFHVGGILDTSYRAALAESVKEAKIAQGAIQRAMKTEMRSVNKTLNKSDPYSAEASAAFIQQQSLLRRQNILFAASAKQRASLTAAEAAEEVAINQEKIEAIMLQEKMAGRVYESEKAAQLAAEDILENERIAKAAESAAARKVMDAETTAAIIRDSTGAMEWAQIEEEARTALAAKEAAERVAIAEAEATAEIAARVSAAAAGKMGVGHGQGGWTGIIRESLVIIREVSMGRGLGRIGGSVTLLAQYLGVLKFAVKSTATESLLAAKAARELSIAMDVQALRAKGTAAFIELESAAKAQNVIATEAETVANYELVTAKVALNAVFFIGAGLIVAAGAAAFFTWRHFHNLAVAAKNLADALNPLKKKYTELAVEQDKAAKAAKENADWIAELNNKHESESNALERKIKLLKEEQAARRRLAEARGASDAELQALDRANLEQEKAMLLVQQARLKTENDTAQAAEQAASSAAIAGATGVDEKGRIITLDQAQSNAKKRGDILDDAQEAAEKTSAGEALGMAQGMHDKGRGSEVIRTNALFYSGIPGMEKMGKEYGTTFDQLAAAVAEDVTKG